VAARFRPCSCQQSGNSLRNCPSTLSPGSICWATTISDMPTSKPTPPNPFATVSRMLPASMLRRETAAEHKACLRELGVSLHAYDPTDQELAEFCGMAVLHGDPWVRAQLLSALPRWQTCNPTEVAETVAWGVHDTDDFVAFRAIELASKMRLTNALPHLFMIVGHASERIRRHAGKPVGMGHALVLRAIVAIAGTEDPDELAKIERQLFEGDYDFPTQFPDQRAVPRQSEGADYRDMVRVSGGTVRFQVPPDLRDTKLIFDWADVTDPWANDVEAFWMDRYAVTTAEYDRFAASDEARAHVHCHPAEPPGKLHVRNTLLDDRFSPEAPATGVDWFDAYAYACANHKRLPTEAEWQRAAQGDDLRVFPWGNTFDSKKAQWVGRVLGIESPSLPTWREQLVHMGHDHPGDLVVPVMASAPSPFGVVGMAGNAWEWTATNFYSRTRLEPAVGDRDSLDVVYDWNSYPVIRGGSWSSLPELTSAAFRGRDLLTDRHFENGFRCVAD
jgi:gamma-glutamyl hercynylcysteine S-oxide synthase